MGSPHKPNKSIIASTISPQYAAFQDSSIFNYINSLSSIKPVKGTSVYSGLTSPPLVFTSPRINTHQQSEFKSSENAPPKVTDLMNPEGSMESNELVEQGHSGNLPEPIENDGCLQSNICQSNVSGDHISVQEYDQQVVQVGQSQLGKRRRLEFEEKTVENETNSQNSPNPIATSAVLESSFSQNIKNPVSKPSGIGLHLNSIFNSMPLSYPIGGKKKLISITPSVSTNANSVENVSVKSDAKSEEMVNYQDNLDQGSMNSQQFERIDDFEKPVPKRRRKKKTEHTGDGCKNCTCKKSKCLKLYCECFAAGIYCSGSCCCEGCFNRPEYEETVLETRKQIESRNPIAFAPKIVQRITQSPTIQTNEGGDQVTPVTAKHKRGCSCRKSMCLKKYCECYQANVGCSDGCRCEGCQNIHGTKSVKGVYRKIRMEAINEELVDSKLEVGPIKSKSEFHKPHTLTPQTPSLQCSNQGKDVAKGLVFPGKYVLSPESECTFFPHYTTTQTPPKDSSTTEPNNTNHETIPYDHESYPMNEFTDEFSPGDWSKSNTSRSQLLPFCFRGSSVTPVTLFGGTKPSFDMIDDDDTTNILRESRFIQPNKVIDRSPNKKRISPPRIRLSEIGSTSLKSGRKFILKSVPSIPRGDNTH